MLKKVSWIRVLVLVSIVVIIGWILAMQNLKKLAQPTPHTITDIRLPFIGVPISPFGKVYFPNRKPAPNTNVYLLTKGPKDITIWHKRNTDSTGFWEFNKVPAHNPMIIATHPGYGFGYFFVKLTTSIDTISIFLNPEHPYSGRITDESGQPLNSINLYLYSINILSQGEEYHFVFGNRFDVLPEFDWLTTSTNENGKYTFKGFPLLKSADIFATRYDRSPKVIHIFGDNTETNFFMSNLLK